MFYKVSEGHTLPHDPLKAIIAPRPIAWVGSRGDAGDNLAPFSFFNLFSAHEIAIGFTDQLGETHKDTLRNILANKEFTVSIPSQNDLEAISNSSAALAPEVSEFAHYAIPKSEAKIINAPFPTGTIATLECTLHSTLPLTGATLVIGSILAVHINDALLENGKIDSAKAAPLVRLGYKDYAHISEVYELSRPK